MADCDCDCDSDSDRAPLEFALDIPFVQALGMQLWRCDSGLAEIRMDVRPEMLNSWQVAHGGVLMTLLDVAMAHAARGVLEPAPQDAGGSGPQQAPSLATLEMKTNFVRPARGPLVATGRLLHGTPGMAFCEGSVRDAAGELCAHATGTFKVLRAPAGAPQRP